MARIKAIDNNESSTKSEPRISLKKYDELTLWLKSGGMCAYPGCYRNLIFDDITEKVCIADKAHIIPHSSDGPRGNESGDYNMSKDEVDSIDNLILFCKIHHKVIDSNPDKYPAADLYKLKKQHEDWVEQRLSKSNKSIAVIHKTKGDPIDTIALSEELGAIIMDSVIFQEKYDDLTPEQWESAKIKNEEFYKFIIETKKKYEGVSCNIFPLSHIPLLIHLGSLISDTLPVYVHQYDRNSQKWVRDCASSQEKQEDIGLLCKYENRNNKQLIVSVGISSPIDKADIDEIISTSQNSFLEITVQDAKIDRVLYFEHIEEIKKIFKHQIEEFLKVNRIITEIHLFYAGPAGLAIELGRSVNKSMWPFINLYHYEFRSNPRYQFAYKI